MNNTPNIITRRIHATIRGSMTQFAHSGTEAANWQVQNGVMPQILGITDIMDGTVDSASTTALLQNALLHQVRILEYKNTFPVALGVNISCVPAKEMTRTGMGYSFTALGDNTNVQPLIVFANESVSEESLQWRANYPEYTPQNLDTKNVLKVDGESFVFINKKHPVIDLLRVNKDILNADIDTHTLIDDQWLKITKQVLHTCCTQLRSKVLSKVGTVDLNSLNVQISRLDGFDWMDHEEVIASLPHLKQVQEQFDASTAQNSNKLNQANMHQAIMNKTFSFHCRLELQFEIMPITVQ